MRPRVFPAEDSTQRSGPFTSTACFNEAAGIPRGRLFIFRRVRNVDAASMRPRVFPAEDPCWTISAIIGPRLQ